MNEQCLSITARASANDTMGVCAMIRIKREQRNRLNAQPALEDIKGGQINEKGLVRKR